MSFLLHSADKAGTRCPEGAPAGSRDASMHSGPSGTLMAMVRESGPLMRPLFHTPSTHIDGIPTDNCRVPSAIRQAATQTYWKTPHRCPGFMHTHFIQGALRHVMR